MKDIKAKVSAKVSATKAKVKAKVGKAGKGAKCAVIRSGHAGGDDRLAVCGRVLRPMSGRQLLPMRGV